MSKKLLGMIGVNNEIKEWNGRIEFNLIKNMDDVTKIRKLYTEYYSKSPQGDVDPQNEFE